MLKAVLQLVLVHALCSRQMASRDAIHTCPTPPLAGAPAKAVQRYASAATALGSVERLKALHYDEASGHFRDYGLHTEEVQLVWKDVPVPEGQAPKVCVI